MLRSVERNDLDIKVTDSKTFDDKRFKLEQLRNLYYTLCCNYNSDDDDESAEAYAEYLFLGNVLSSRDAIKNVDSKTTEYNI